MCCYITYIVNKYIRKQRPQYRALRNMEENTQMAASEHLKFQHAESAKWIAVEPSNMRTP